MGYRTTKYKIKAESNKASNNYTDFFYYTFRNILLVSIPLVIIFALILSIPHSSATVSGASADSLTLSLPTSCTLSSVIDSPHNTTMVSGLYEENIGKTIITTLCNDGNGYAIYANGLSNGTVGNNALISSVSSNHDIATGIYEQGDTTSSWAMKLGNVSGDTSPTPPVIEQNYNNTYGLVPSTWTKVAGRQSGTTDMITGSSFTTTYAVYTSPTQHAGTYTGQVAYALIHGSGDSPAPIYFMQDVANWKDSLQLGESVRAIDTRDAKTYWVTKLADGHIWMTQNLDLEIGGANTAPLNSNNTDISTDPNVYASSGIYSDYNVSNGVYTWNPVSTAITSNTTISDNIVSPAWPADDNGNTKPYSAEGKDNYFYSSNSTSNDTRYTSLKDCTTAHPIEGECERYFAGNYYNWTAAIASNDSTNLGSIPEQIAPNSICPKGWRLPNPNELAKLNQLYNNKKHFQYIFHILLTFTLNKLYIYIVNFQINSRGIFMKYVVVLYDGMADYPVDALNGKTPMEVAKKPNLDNLARFGKMGIVKTVGDGLKPGSDIANMSVLGYNPKECYTGRSPLEAVSIGVDMKDTDIIFRCNLVTLSSEENYEDKNVLVLSKNTLSIITYFSDIVWSTVNCNAASPITSSLSRATVIPGESVSTIFHCSANYKVLSPVVLPYNTPLVLLDN